MNRTCRAVAAALVIFACPFLDVRSAVAIPPLQQAAADGNVDEVRRLIAADPNVLLARDEMGTSALHHAAWNGQSAVVQALLDLGVPPDYPKRKAKESLDGGTALHHAAVTGQVEVARLLLKAGAKVDAQDAELNTPLHHAAWHNQVAMAKLLLDAGANPNARRTQKVMPLEEAAFFGHNDMALLLIARGADVNARVHGGNTPLHQAVRNNHWRMCQILVGSKAELETPDDEGRTPLHVAAQSGQKEALYTLIAVGGDVNAKDNGGRTPLALAQGEAVTILEQELKRRSEAEANDVVRASLNAKLAPGRKIAETVVYKSRFAGEKPGKEWSTSPLGPHVGALEVKSFPGGSRRYLGEFGTQAVRLALPKLPPHSQVTVTVNVIAMYSWDGNGIMPGFGPDIWEASLVGGPTLFRTTFCTYTQPENAATPIQAFPGEWPRVFKPGGTGAIATNLLKRNATKENPEGERDAVFGVTFTFAHDAPNLVLSFGARGLEELSNERWGIGSVEVRVGRSTAKPAKAARR